MIPDLLAGLHIERVLLDLVLVMGLAVLLGTVLQRMGQSAILGYLLAGLVLGPGALGLVVSVEAFSTMAERGVALLLFAIGLELSWSRLRHGGRVTPWAGTSQLLVTGVAAAVVLGLVLGDWSVAIVCAMVVSLSSTAVVLRVLADRAELDSTHGYLSLSVLLVQDIVTVLFLIVVPQLVGDAAPLESLIAVGISAAKVALLVLTMFVADRLVLRRLFPRVASAPERELLAILVLVISLGAAGMTDAMGLSAALGGFVAGLFIGDAPYSDQVRAEIAPIRTALVLVFFAYVGMLADVAWIFDNLLLVLGLAVAVIAGKAVLGAASLRLVRVPHRVSLLAGASLAQMGEFGFVIAAEALAVGAIGEDVFRALVSTTLVTLLATPYLIQAANWFAHRAVVDGGRREADHGQVPHTREHAVVVGHGPAGERVVEEMTRLGVFVVVVELNPRTHEIAEEGLRVVYGDAGRAEILTRADISHARVVVLTVPEPLGLRRILGQVRLLAPDVPVVARGRYHMYIPQILEAGATTVVDEEGHTGHLLAAEAAAVLQGDALPSPGG